MQAHEPRTGAETTIDLKELISFLLAPYLLDPARITVEVGRSCRCHRQIRPC